MNENTVDKIDIIMKDGRTYFGMLPVPGATNMQEKRLVVRFPEEDCLLVLNWPDIGRVHILGGK